MLLLGGGPVDRRIYEALYAGRRPLLLEAARVFTAMGEPTLLIGAGVVAAVWLWVAGHRQLPWVLTAIVLVGRGLSEAQKYWIARVRPDLEPHLVVVRTSSFPSGHATSSMIFFLTLALVLSRTTRWRGVAVSAALLLSFLIGTSRVMLGVHWPSDVIGGWAFGLLWVMLTLRLARRLIETDSEGASNQLWRARK
ncbi:phosphatase PAP2 family protein [Sphingomonas sp. URHD0057]|uniref:phosphatase PAP2 family protein n=1 Tax=Sphingomonas sp. URHD0057 TaxID=1380389 RepID=UPI000683D8FC|nr:phosphatase PAP2 family protein [Sphingomonas sp. URHD0057]